MAYVEEMSNSNAVNAPMNVGKVHAGVLKPWNVSARYKSVESRAYTTPSSTFSAPRALRSRSRRFLSLVLVAHLHNSCAPRFLADPLSLRMGFLSSIS